MLVWGKEDWKGRLSVSQCDLLKLGESLKVLEGGLESRSSVVRGLGSGVEKWVEWAAVGGVVGVGETDGERDEPRGLVSEMSSAPREQGCAGWKNGGGWFEDASAEEHWYVGRLGDCSRQGKLHTKTNQHYPAHRNHGRRRRRGKDARRGDKKEVSRAFQTILSSSYYLYDVSNPCQMHLAELNGTGGDFMNKKRKS